MNDFNVTTDATFTIIVQQSMRITSMLPQRSFSNYDNATINADNFNVTTDSTLNNYNNKNATINADNFNVTAVNTIL